MKKSILITGASGYLASHLAKELITSNLSVTLIDKNPTQKNILGIKIHKVDLLNLNKKNEILFKNISDIFHFAGIADIKESNENPIKSFDNNIKATALLIEMAVKNNIKRFFFASTLYVYSKKGGIYKITKKTCEDLLTYYVNKYPKKFKLIILKFGSIYGGKANHFNLIKNLILCGLNNKKFTSQTLTGNEVRSYVHINDVVNICKKIFLKKSRKIEHILISSNEKVKIKKLLKILNSLMNTNIIINFSKTIDNDHYQKNVFDTIPKDLIHIKKFKYIKLIDGLKMEIKNLSSDNNFK